MKNWLNNPQTNILEVISNDNPWPALKQLNTVRKLKISVVPEHILKSPQRDPRIYLKKNLLPLPLKETAEHKDISTHHPSPPIGIIKASPRTTTGRVLEIITMDLPPPPKRVLAIITLD